jgi:hypothetical protein
MTKLVSAEGTHLRERNDVFDSAHKTSTQRLEQSFEKLSGSKVPISHTPASAKNQSRKP